MSKRFILINSTFNHQIRLGNQTDAPLRGVSPTIRYLQKLGPDQFELVLRYSRWVLEKDPKNGMDVRPKDV